MVRRSVPLIGSFAATMPFSGLINFFKQFSPLTARILVVNSLPLVILVGSILYFSGYQDRLMQNEFDSMQKEARQFAAALGDGAVISSDDDRDILLPELAERMAERLIDTAEALNRSLDENDDREPPARTRLYDNRGAQIVDTLTVGQRNSVQREELPAPMRWPAMHEAMQNMHAWWRRRTWPAIYPLYQENPEPSSADYGIVEKALDGEDARQVWTMRDGRVLMGVAVPVQRYKGVLGAVLLTRPGDKIEQAVNGVQVDILSLFLVTLALTVMLSLYLGRTIVAPLKELARAAKGVETGQSGALKWQLSLPDLTTHRDEIGDLSIALRAMVKALGERMHAIETFAADVAHEIKNPLTSLHSAVETALRLDNPEKRDRLMQVIADDVKRLDRLITDISQASRLEAELNRTKLQDIVLQKMLQMVVDLYASHDWDEAESTDQRPARVVLLKDEGMPALIIQGAETRLAQVFQNLIDNALSFSPKGGAVVISLSRQGRVAEIRVRDNGPGMPENKLDAIFDRFYSERPATEKFGQHSGLGLSIAKQIVEAHKGTIRAENINGPTGVQGACFIVKLPLIG